MFFVLQSSYRMLQESSSSHNIPHSVPSSSTEKLGISSLHHSPLPPPHQMLSYSMSNSSDLAGGGGNLSSPSHSMSTPQFKKKFMHDGMGSKSGSTGSGHKDGSSGLVSKHESFDYPGSMPFVDLLIFEDFLSPISLADASSAISLTRSGSFLSSAGITSAGPMVGTPVSGRPYHHHASPQAAQPQHGGSSHRKGSFDGNNGGASDDSMHEKYFKSVENTPVTRRRHTTTSSSKSSSVQQKHSSDSSPQSPISPQQAQQQHQQRIARPSALAVELSPSSASAATNYNKSSQKSNDPELFNLDLTSKPEKYLDKMKIDKGKVSPSSISMGGGSGPQTASLQKTSSSSGKLSSSQSEMAAAAAAAAAVHNKAISKDQFSLNLNKPNLERHNKELLQQKQLTLEKKPVSGSTQTVASNNSASHNKGSLQQQQLQQQQQQQERKKSRNQNNQGTGFDFDYDNGNTSPLYCNWDKVSNIGETLWVAFVLKMQAY